MKITQGDYEAYNLLNEGSFNTDKIDYTYYGDKIIALADKIKMQREQLLINGVVRPTTEEKHPIEGVNETIIIDQDTEEEQLPYNCYRCGEEQEFEGTCGCCEMELRENL